MKWYQKAMKYFSKYPDQNAFVHLLLGIGLGFMLTYPVAQSHPVRWGMVFVAMSVIGHIYASFQKVK